MNRNDPPRARGHRSLAIEADLLLNTPTGPVAVHGDGSRLVARVSSLSQAWRLAAVGPGRKFRRRTMRWLDAGLRRGRLHLTIQLAADEGRPLARLGHGARPGLLARVWGLPGLELRWRTLFAALRHRLRPSSR